MENAVQLQTEQINIARTKKRRWQKLLTGLAAIVVFCTTYAMILPAITKERSLICDVPEHTHTEDCYETAEIPAETQLICTAEEHFHGDECYEDVLICGIVESDEHTHTDECYEKRLFCTIAEHTHTDECYTLLTEAHEEQKLICTLEAHTHTDACYDAIPAPQEKYQCGFAEHTHSAELDCFFPDGTLKCTIPEHIHTEECEQKEVGVKMTIESNMASDGAIAVITGKLPMDATAEIQAVELTDEQLTEYFGAEKASSMTGFVAYDIKILSSGEEWEPNETVSVLIRHPDITVKSGEACAVAHVDGETDSVSELSAEVGDDGGVSFETDGFSTYIIYTVEFWYGDYMYSINGHSDILLSELFLQLGIEADAKDAVSVIFSDPSLITVEQTENDWRLLSDVPFLTEELLTVTFRDGTVLPITVTDDYQPVVPTPDNPVTVVHPVANKDLWAKNDKLNSPPAQPYAYYYHTDIAANKTTDGYTIGQKVNNQTISGPHYIFSNDADTDDNDLTYNAVEFRNAFKAYGKDYNVCVKIHLNSEIEGTIRWGDRTFVDYSSDGGGANYLSVGLFSVDGYTTQQLTSSLPFDISWEMWLEDPTLPADEREPVTWIPLMGGSCYVGHEYVMVYSTDNSIYHNYPLSGKNETLVYRSGNSYKIANHVVEGWYNTVDNNDLPVNYALGIADVDGIVEGRYITEWTATGSNSFACELTANLYDTQSSLTVRKVVEGENSHVTDDTLYHFRVQQTNSTTSTAQATAAFGNLSYTIYNADSGTQVSTGTLSGSEFTLKNGQYITINGVNNYRKIRVIEYTSKGTSSSSRDYDYFPYLEGTTAMVNGTAQSLTDGTVNNTGAKYVEFSRSGTATSQVIFTNTLKEDSTKLKITKKLQGMSDSSRTFSFTATATNGQISAGTGYTLNNGVASFSLGDNESVTLNVSKGTTVTVSESGTDGFKVRFTDDDDESYSNNVTSDSFTLTGNRNITVTNMLAGELPSTGGHGALPFHIAGAMLVLISVLGYRIKRKKRAQ